MMRKEVARRAAGVRFVRNCAGIAVIALIVTVLLSVASSDVAARSTPFSFADLVEKLSPSVVNM